MEARDMRALLLRKDSNRTPIYSGNNRLSTWAEHRKEKLVFTDGSGKSKTVNVETFPWGKARCCQRRKRVLDYKTIFGDINRQRNTGRHQQGEILISPFDPRVLGPTLAMLHLSLIWPLMLTMYWTHGSTMPSNILRWEKRGLCSNPELYTWVPLFEYTRNALYRPLFGEPNQV